MCDRKIKESKVAIVTSRVKTNPFVKCYIHTYIR